MFKRRMWIPVKQSGLLGNADGIIKVINIINGAIIKHGKVESLPICDFHYCTREKCLIVTSGTEIDVFDEDICSETSEGVKLPLLRRARNIHSKDICASTFSPDFCAIVTAALDGSVCIWDFQELHLLVSGQRLFLSVCSWCDSTSLHCLVLFTSLLHFIV